MGPGLASLQKMSVLLLKCMHQQDQSHSSQTSSIIEFLCHSSISSLHSVTVGYWTPTFLHKSNIHTGRSRLPHAQPQGFSNAQPQLACSLPKCAVLPSCIWLAR